MRFRVVLMLLSALSLWGEGWENRIEHTNYTLSLYDENKEERYWLNSHRLRFDTRYTQEGWFASAIADVQNVLGSEYIRSDLYLRSKENLPGTQWDLQSGYADYGSGEVSARIHRLYGGYSMGSDHVSAGFQKISFGVGRIWNPTDCFNPKNPFSLEPLEVAPTLSAVYTRSVDPLSQMSFAVAEDGRYAARFKTHHVGVDTAVSMIYSDQFKMGGYEIEGEYSGIGLRSEGGWFESGGHNTFRGIAGGDYAFENSLIVTMEWLYVSDPAVSNAMPNFGYDGTSHHYAGVALSYDPHPLWQVSLSSIVNAEDSSAMVRPYVQYSWSDAVRIGTGAMVYTGEAGGEFSALHPLWYLQVSAAF